MLDLIQWLLGWTKDEGGPNGTRHFDLRESTNKLFSFGISDDLLCDGDKIDHRVSPISV